MNRPEVSSEATYRFDLDGLRGVAVALVVGYHVWGNQVSGGVDAFLVLSGYFLARSLLRRGLPTRFLQAAREAVQQMAHFILRLLPAASLTLLVTLLAAVRLLPTSRWSELSRQVLASLLSFENWHLATTDQVYAAASGEVSPTQQFWSLSVQVQVYAVVTLAVALAALALRRTRNVRRLLAAATAVAALASFLYAVRQVVVDQDTAYYDSVARAWEFLVGVTLGLSLPTVIRVDRLRTAIRSVLGLTALVGLLGTGVLVDGGSQFPGVATLLPVGAAAALVAVGLGGSRVWSNRILTLPGLRRLGEISYPLYLWHWPLLVLALDLTGRSRAGWLLGGLVAAASVGLAWITHLGLELPLRGRGRLRLPRQSSRVVSTGLVLVTAVLPALWLGHTARITADVVPVSLTINPTPETSGNAWGIVPAPEVAADDGPGTADRCASPRLGNDVKVCTFGDPTATRTMVAVGGSHVRMFIPALDDIARQHGFRLISMVKVGCPWSLATQKLDWDPAIRASCRTWGDAATQAILQLSPDIVLTTGTRPRLRGPGDRIPPRYPRRWWTLDRAGIPMVLMRDTPWLPQDPPDCISAQPNVPLADLLHECGASRTTVLSPDPLGDFTGRIPPSARWVDLTPQLCPSGWCLPVVGNVLAYRDAGHLTTTFVRAIEPELSRQLGAATGWWHGS